MNDVKRDLTVVEIVYGESMMAACLLDLFGKDYTGNPKELFDVVVSGVPLILMRPFASFVVVVKRLFIWVAGHPNRLPLNICCPQHGLQTLRFVL